MKEIMSKEAFEEIIDNIEIISNLTLYARKNIKYYLNKLQEENKQLKANLYEANSIISDYIDTVKEKNKIIDKMAGHITNGTIVKTYKEICKNMAEEINCVHTPINEVNCVNCVKQYFKRKIESEE
ncbi:MAG: hypothetical protein J6A89_04040 [Clostridia bacterium]|nr:hypothetical protein [Clostridia bacterium]